jgi:hypothetical protein
MSVSDDNKENQKIAHDLCHSSRPLIFLVDDKEENIVNNSGRRVRIGIRNRNEAELTEELTVTIKQLLWLSGTALTLESKHCLLTNKDSF